jgi:hypothetical protein
LLLIITTDGPGNAKREKKGCLGYGISMLHSFLSPKCLV